MAGVTSLPELATGLSAVASDLPDIAVGNILGSCVFNVFILGILDTLSRKVPLSSKVNQANILSAGMSVLFLGGMSLSLFLGTASRAGMDRDLHAAHPPGLFGDDAHGLQVREEALRRRAAWSRTAGVQDDLEGGRPPLCPPRDVVVGAAIFLPSIAERIAEMTGLGQTFVGNIFVAISTSLPEMTVSLAAMRIGAVDMAVGNIFGSNIFNMFILAIEDIFYFKGPILSFVQSQNLIPSLLAIAMTGLAIAGLIYNAEKKLFIWAWDSFGIILIFPVNLVLLYLLH